MGLLSTVSVSIPESDGMVGVVNLMEAELGLQQPCLIRDLSQQIMRLHTIIYMYLHTYMGTLGEHEHSTPIQHLEICEWITNHPGVQRRRS